MECHWFFIIKMSDLEEKKMNLNTFAKLAQRALKHKTNWRNMKEHMMKLSVCILNVEFWLLENLFCMSYVYEMYFYFDWVTHLIVFELSLTPSNKLKSWYHDFITKVVSPPNKDESEIRCCIGWDLNLWYLY